MKKWIALALALVMVFALAACGGKTEPTPTKAPETETPNVEPTKTPTTEPTQEPEPTGEPIKIGHICDLTGTEAMIGAEEKLALEFAVKHLGNNIAGRPVEIIESDGMSSTDTAVDAAVRMVENDGVCAILGPTQVGQKAGVSEYMAEAEVPLIFYNGSPAYLFMKNPWLIGAGGANPQMNVIADYAYNELGYRRVNILTMDNTGFITFADEFEKLFTALGGEIVDRKYVPFGTSDWSVYFASMQDADAIMAWSTSSNATGLWNDWYNTGMYKRQPIVGIMQSAFTEYYIMNAIAGSDKAVAEAAMGTYAPSAYVPDIDTPENKEFVEAWTEEFGVAPASTHCGQVYQAYLLLKTAIESIDGEITNESLLAALKSADIYGPAGHLYFDGSGAANKDIYIARSVQLEDGTYSQETVKVYKDVPPTGLTAESK